MKSKQLCELFGEPNDKHGRQFAFGKLGLRLSGRNWTLRGRELLYMGFRFSRNVVTFSLITNTGTGCCTAQTFEISIEEAIDCISGKIDNLLTHSNDH